MSEQVVLRTRSPAQVDVVGAETLTDVNAANPLAVQLVNDGVGLATAAGQASQLTQATAAATVLGATSGAAVVTDANGTVQQYLRGLVKLFLAGFSINQTTPGTTDHVTGSGFATAVGATVQRPADTNAYAIGDIVAQSTTAASCSGVAIAVSRGNDLTGMLRRCRVKVNDAAWLGAELYVHVFKDPPTFGAGDNGAFTANLTESNYIGAFDVVLDRQFSDPYVKGIGVPRAGSEMNFEPHTGSPNIYYVIETRTAVTPGSGKIFSVIFEVLQN